MPFKLLWCTDTHLNLLRIADAPKSFGEYLVAEHPCDAVLTTGDISEAWALKEQLELFAQGLQKVPHYFVLGNHDYYAGSFEKVPKIAQKFEGWLDNGQVVELTPQTALVGSEGWYDALIGLPNANFFMTDWHKILELHKAYGNFEKNRKKVIEISRARSARFAAKAKAILSQTLAKYSSVVFATHYPPFLGASWHEGHVSSPESVPWFSSKLMGDALQELALEHPQSRILVLCGHTHSQGLYRHLPNLCVLTGRAVYGSPDWAGLIEVDGADMQAQLSLGSGQHSIIDPFDGKASHGS